MGLFNLAIFKGGRGALFDPFLGKSERLARCLEVLSVPNDSTHEYFMPELEGAGLVHASPFFEPLKGLKWAF